MGIKALVVDDSPFARKVIRHHLEACGCTVVAEAENPVQAVKQFEEHQPQIVTLDVMMPQVDGMDSLAAFRAMKKHSRDVAIVLASVITFDKTRDVFLKEGAIGYVVKPFNRFSFEPVRQKLARMFPQLAA